MSEHTIIHISNCESTNSSLIELNTNEILKSGISLTEGTTLWSDYQSAGKGQRGNSWESENGKNLLFSILLYPTMVKANRQFLISQVVTLGIATFLSNYTSDISIKWPNDIYWKERKICGVLIENFLEEDRIESSVCGIGININQTEFRSNAPNPVSLKQITSQEYPLGLLLDEVRERIMFFYKILQNKRTDFIEQCYKANMFRKDGFHIFNDGSSNFYAKIKDVEQSGILVLECDNGTERRFAFKEVKYII